MNGEGLTVDYQQGYCDGMRLIRQMIIVFYNRYEEMWEHINRETKRSKNFLLNLKKKRN